MHEKVNAACKTGILYNRCGMLSLWGGAFVRMSTDKYGMVRSQAPQNTAGFAQQQNTPLFFESERGVFYKVRTITLRIIIYPYREQSLFEKWTRYLITGN